MGWIFIEDSFPLIKYHAPLFEGDFPLIKYRAPLIEGDFLLIECRAPLFEDGFLFLEGGFLLLEDSFLFLEGRALFLDGDCPGRVVEGVKLLETFYFSTYKPPVVSITDYLAAASVLVVLVLLLVLASALLTWRTFLSSSLKVYSANFTLSVDLYRILPMLQISL